MIYGHDDNPAARQLRWVVLLLAIVVILPTVCLIWFMAQAVRNERLAVHQKLDDFYQGRLDNFKTLANSRNSYLDHTKLILSYSEYEPARMFADLIESEAVETTEIAAAVIYDKSGQRVYPFENDRYDIETEFPLGFEQAWEFEFTDEDYVEAINKYAAIAAQTTNDYTWAKAMIGQIRCLQKLGNTTRARILCRRFAYEPDIKPLTAEAVNLSAQGRILYAEMDQDPNLPEDSALEMLLKTANTYYPKDPLYLSMESETRIFMLQRAVELFDDSWSEKLEPLADKAGHCLKAETLSVQAAKIYPTTKSFAHWPPSTVRAVELPEKMYGLWQSNESKTAMLIVSDVFFNKSLSPALEHIGDEKDIYFRLLDDRGRYFAGSSEFKDSKNATQPFLANDLGKIFTGWEVQLFLTDGDIFNRQAKRQITIYIWAAVLVIFLILATGALAENSIRRQMKLNRLKNDFVATVTHELKTPLASMRMLVDTLLEGRYKDENQVTEYLQLVAKENKRLSRLIDNFLTFSRMERNKHAFEIESSDAAAIANEAADAVRNRFERADVRFEINIAESLNPVKADPDALVTVLVNLLDNAFKYSGDDKHITMKVYEQNEYCCFDVSDNGIGMPPRIVKKIFDRFYQADQSLARTAEGCGLGLSIVKFIVDAHHGKISVDSSAGKGTKFSIRIPSTRKDQT